MSTEQYPSSSQHGDVSMSLRKVSKQSSNPRLSIMVFLTPVCSVQMSEVLRPSTLSCCCCSVRPQILKTESNSAAIVMQERSFTGTASADEGIEIHRVVSLGFPALMLILGVSVMGFDRADEVGTVVRFCLASFSTSVDISDARRS